MILIQLPHRVDLCGFLFIVDQYRVKVVYTPLADEDDLVLHGLDRRPIQLFFLNRHITRKSSNKFYIPE